LCAGPAVLRSLAGLLLYGCCRRPLSPSPGATPLDHVFIGLSTFTARFDQTSHDTDAKWRRHHETPAARSPSSRPVIPLGLHHAHEQLVFGRRVSICGPYDADLEQATIKPQGDALAVRRRCF